MKSNTPAVARAIELVTQRGYSASAAARECKVALSSVRRALRRANVPALGKGGRPVNLF